MSNDLRISVTIKIVLLHSFNYDIYFKLCIFTTNSTRNPVENELFIFLRMYVFIPSPQVGGHTHFVVTLRL